MKRCPLIALILCALFALGACAPVSAPPSPTPQLTPTSAPTPSPTPAPVSTPVSTPQPTPTSAAYSAKDFLPPENIFISYNVPSDGSTLNSYVEFIKPQGDSLSVQRRVLDGQAPLYVQVLSYSDGELRLQYQVPHIGYTYDFTEKYQDTQEIWLMDPIEEGTEWEIEKGHSQITSVNAAVALPLGTFDAIEVTTYFEDGSTCRRYFVAGLGLVSQYENNADGQIGYYFEAVKRETGKTFEQSMRVFYADQSDGTIKYKLFQVAIAPNTRMTALFKEYFSIRRPSGSKLIPMSDSVKINSISLSGGTVTVDFSEELVTQMQLSHRNERNFLQALANTFGEYYQRKKVVFTVESQTYQSRYITLLEGDYFEVLSSAASRYKE